MGGWRGGGITFPPPHPSVKVVRFILETWNLVHIYLVSENIAFSIKTPKLGKNSFFTKSNDMRAVLEIFKFCFNFFQDRR